MSLSWRALLQPNHGDSAALLSSLGGANCCRHFIFARYIDIYKLMQIKAMMMKYIFIYKALQEIF